METINTIFYFLIVIGILVFIHELGHFLAARFTGMRAEVFALGIGYRLFGWNKINGFTFGKMDEEIDLGDNTDYRICAFPIGGYVKVSGMVDESMDKDFISKDPMPYEYRAKPVWKRMIVITAGVIMNFLLAFLIFYFLTLAKGKTITDTTTIGYIAQQSPSSNSDLKIGDKILSINNTEVTSWDQIQAQLYFENLGEPLNILVNRNGSDQIVSIPKDKVGDLTERNFGIYPEGMTAEIGEVVPGSPAESCGLQKGDLLTGINGIDLISSQQVTDLIRENADRQFVIKWNRDSESMSCEIKPSADSTIGVMIAAKYTGPTKEIKYNVISAIPKAGYDMYHYGIELFFKSIGKIIKGDVEFKKAIGGPVKIAQASAQSAEGGIYTFLGFLALLSISLAVINILPFPALDGGHLMLLIYEGIVRKPVPYKVQIILQNVGFALLLAFMIFVIYNDIISIK
ncbi:MAG TPA: RIP metalloprotease RseP [Ignavibacteria bacterium]|nr:RIP metalloprotease RseP [Ignavibacteria bacterium]HMR40533.1 RIP metalloprotease RseP [Ignavibacteria bacterium]